MSFNYLGFKAKREAFVGAALSGRPSVEISRGDTNTGAAKECSPYKVTMVRQS